MGMDSVELIINVETAFGITISDREATSVVTVADLYAIVLRTMALLPGGKCRTAKMFYELRRDLGKLGEIPQRLRPSTPLAQAVPAARRRAVWRTLAQGKGLKLPALTYSPRELAWLWRTAGVMAVAAGICVGILPGLWCGILGGLSGPVLLWLCSPWARRHAPRCPTFGDLVRAVTTLNGGLTRSDNGKLLSGHAIWCTLRQVIAESLGVKEEEIRPELRFYEDLNVG